MDTKLATQQFATLAQLFQQDPDGVDFILKVAAEAMQSGAFHGDGIPGAFRKAVGDAINSEIDICCNGCLHDLRIDCQKGTEEFLANLTAEQIEAARLEQIEQANGNEHRIARINESFEAVTKRYPAAFAALKVLQEQGWLSDPGADLPEEQLPEEPQAVAA
jgi:hypothetical protein